MLKEEDYRLIGLIAEERTGKSTYIKQNIIESGAYDWRTQRCLILTEAEPSCYAGIKRVDSYDMLKKFSRGIIKFWDKNAKDEFDMMHKIRQLLQDGYLQNGLFVMEDAGIYLQPNTPSEIRSVVLSRRMFKIDVVAVFHSFRDYPAFMRRRTNHFIVGKNLDTITDAKELARMQFPNAQGLYDAHTAIQQRVAASGNRFIKQVVNTGT